MRAERRIFHDAAALAEAAAARWAELYTAAVADHGAFHVALSGGITPNRTYQRLAQPDLAAHMDWTRIHIYFGDERCVPPDSGDSNFRLAREALLRHVPCPDANVHRIAGEAAPEAAAAAYARTLLTAAPQASGFPRLDLVLLGVGSDGHTASLFPGTAILDVADRAVAAVFVEQQHTARISLTLPAINNARNILVLCEGEAKAEVVGEVFEPTRRTPVYPIERVQPRAGRIEWYLDRAAARHLETTR